MPVKNVIEKSKSMIGKINPYYDMYTSNMQEMYSVYAHRPYDLMVCSFRFGYLQGMKAAKAEMKRGGGELNGRPGELEEHFRFRTICC